MMTRFSTSICLILMTQTCVAIARENKPEPGWAGADDWEAARESSIESNRPIAAILAFRDPPGDDDQQDEHNSGYNAFARNAALKNLIRVVFFDEDKSPGAEDLKGQLGAFTRYYPMLFFVDPQGKVIATLDHKSRDRTTNTTKIVAGILSWRAKSKDQIAKADKDAGNGKFKDALKAIVQLADQDDDQARAVVVLKNGDDMAKVQVPPSQKKIDENLTLPGLIETKTTEYDALLKERCKRARDFLDAGDATKARTTIQPIVQDNAGLPSMKHAKAILEDARKAEQAGKKQ